MESPNSKRKAVDDATPPSATDEEKTVALALLDNPVSVTQLRKLVWQRGGFQCNLIRLRAWCTLLGVNHHKASHTDYELTPAEMENLLESEPIHQQVELDVARSMSQWTILDKWSDDRKAEKRKTVGNIIHALISKHSSRGFHDIVTAVLIVTGDHHLTYAVVEQLSHYYFRDCMRDNFELISHLLKLIPFLIEYFDKDLADYLSTYDMPPFFALPWFITWFSHDVTDINVVARLFDVFMGSHPLLPLYVCTALLIHKRNSIFALHDEDESHFGTLHGYLTSLPRNVNLRQWEMILVESKCMLENLSPKALLKRSSWTLQAKIFFHAPMSFQFPPPWFTDTSLPDWTQLQNLSKKLGKQRKTKRRNQVVSDLYFNKQCTTESTCHVVLSHILSSWQQALQRITDATVQFSDKKITSYDKEKKRSSFWPILPSYKERVPSLLATPVTVGLLASVFGILIAMKISFHIPFHQ